MRVPIIFIPIALLAGCFRVTVPLGPGEVSVQLSADFPKIGVCATRTVTEVVGSYRALEPGSEWVVFLRAGGSVDVRYGEVIDLERLSTDFTITTLEDLPPSGIQLTVTLKGDGSAIQGLYEFNEPPPADRWLHNDGTATEEMCV